MTHSNVDVPQQFNFARHLLDLNRARAAKAAYIDDSGSITYGELDRRVRCFAAGLLAQGVQPEQRVLLVMQDTVDLPVALLGALFAGMIPVPVNTLLHAADYAYMIDHSRARMIVASAALLPCVREALGLARNRPALVVSGDPGDPGDADLTRFGALLAAEPLAPDANFDSCGDDFAFWLYSSGSTGRPKGAVHSHANLFWTAELYGKPVLGIREDDIVFSAAKLFFAYGLGNALTFPLSVGATVVLMAERPTPQAVFARLARHRATVFAGVPTLYVAMLASDALPPREQVALRVCASAGEALPRPVGEAFRAHFGCDILDGLGSTEMLHIFVSNRAGDVHYGSSGLPVPGYDIALRDDDGNPSPVGEIGDLYVRGPSAAMLYWANRDKSRATFQGEWLKTGDKYSMDADGYLTYAGRGDDMLKVSGQYVSPIEVEAALSAHPAVLECAVVGRCDADGLTKTAAYIVLAWWPRSGRRAGGRAQGLRQGAPGAAQVSARTGLPGRPAEDGDRQDPALPPARCRVTGA